MGPVELDHHSQPVVVCADRACPGWGRSDAEHFDMHNRLCAHYSVGDDGTEIVCELPEGHEPPCRGSTRRAS